MITLLLALAAVQDTTIVIHPDSSGASLEARALPRLVSEEVIRFYNAPSTTRLVGRSRLPRGNEWRGDVAVRDRKSTRLNSSHLVISYAVFCLKKKKKINFYVEANTYYIVTDITREVKSACCSSLS